jgi:hypothetical protein
MRKGKINRTMTARQATDQLTIALLNMAARGERTHCSDPTSHHLWLSEDQRDRDIATKLCTHCPVIVECGQAAAARDERWGVWGGRDRSIRPERPKKQAA